MVIQPPKIILAELLSKSQLRFLLQPKFFTAKAINLFDNRQTSVEQFIGVNVPQGKPEKIVLRFKNNIGKYMLTQPIHSSQKLISDNGDSHDFEYRLAVNQEFIGVLLSWGENVEVIEPKGLREQFKITFEKSLKAYVEG